MSKLSFKVNVHRPEPPSRRISFAATLWVTVFVSILLWGIFLALAHELFTVLAR